MSEEIKEQAAGNSGEGSESKADGLVERADAIAKRLEEANKTAQEVLARNEQILAMQRLGGRSEAGQPSKPLTADDIAQKQADEVIAKYFKK